MEDGEECDGGIFRNDNCCQPNCKLRTNAKCSPLNHGCCTEDCKIKTNGEICIEAQPSRCQGNSQCDGESKMCPKPPPIDDERDCGPVNEMSKCRQGKCIAFCETINKISCQCKDKDNECNWCCKNSKNSQCKPHFFSDNQTRHLSDGRPCLTGLCLGGTCKKSETDIERLWKIIENLHPSRIG